MVKGNGILKFGTGDINVVAGYKPNTTVGVVAFRNQEPREIVVGVNNGDEPSLDLDDYNITMEFDSTKSIDVVIHALQQAKNNMIHKCARCEHGNCETMYCELLDAFINKHECDVCEEYKEGIKE